MDIDFVCKTVRLLMDKLVKERLQEYNKCFITNKNIQTVPDGPFSTLTYVLKDVYVTKDLLTTGGSNILNNYYPSYSCTVHKILQTKGCRFMGKSVLDEFSCGSLGRDIQIGPKISNPLNPNIYMGGSSSGSAYCVATDFCDFALGTDTGGSVRLPAILSKIYGFKPSYGLNFQIWGYSIM